MGGVNYAHNMALLKSINDFSIKFCKGATSRVVICSASDSESGKTQISTTNNSACLWQWHTFLNIAEK
jgi:hypothetical protein